MHNRHVEPIYLACDYLSFNENKTTKSPFLSALVIIRMASHFNNHMVKIFFI